jgi:predicted ArsR family transcriptional regulator
LLEQGNVKVIGELPSSSRGRPAQLYSTIHQIDQNNLDRLTDVLLAELLNNCPLEQRELLIKNIARRMCSSFKIDSKNPTHRLYTAIQFLNHNRYQAHWEAHFESPRIMFGHCPYKAILDQHPEMCQMDTYLLGDLLETPTKQVAKLAPTPRGLPQCIFLINISS